jgi:Phosphoserine phosphatase RsbU, N-terminal domain/GAF domain
VSAGTGPFRSAYASALVDYLLEPSETSLRVAYELAREAVGRSFSVLELADAHQQALMSVLLDASDTAEAQAIARAAGDFFLEGLSTFEMVQRGFAEAREAALLERRQTRLSRQLSTFLADASLALDASDSLEEMLRLVAEQARELVGADCCVATVSVGGRPRTAEGASYQEDERRWTMFIRWLDLLAIYRVLRQSGGSVRAAGEQLARLHPFCTADSAQPFRGWLAASLTALDGSELGAIQLFDKQGAGFTVDDEAALVHLAQMTSAAVERARLYHERG